MRTFLLGRFWIGRPRRPLRLTARGRSTRPGPTARGTCCVSVWSTPPPGTWPRRCRTSRTHRRRSGPTSRTGSCWTSGAAVSRPSRRVCIRWPTRDLGRERRSCTTGSAPATTTACRPMSLLTLDWAATPPWPLLSRSPRQTASRWRCTRTMWTTTRTSRGSRTRTSPATPTVRGCPPGTTPARRFSHLPSSRRASCLWRRRRGRRSFGATAARRVILMCIPPCRPGSMWILTAGRPARGSSRRSGTRIGRSGVMSAICTTARSSARATTTGIGAASWTAWKRSSGRAGTTGKGRALPFW